MDSWSSKIGSIVNNVKIMFISFGLLWKLYQKENSTERILKPKNYYRIILLILMEAWSNMWVILNNNGNSEKNYVHFFKTYGKQINSRLLSMGFASWMDSGENQGGFVVVPRSHKYHRTYFVDKGMSDFNKNWYLVPL